MTDYTWPDSLAPFAQAFYLQPHTGGTESPFSRQAKTYELSAPRWICRMSIRGGQQGAGLRGKGAALDGFLARVGGRANRVLVHDFRRAYPSNDVPLLTFDGGETFDLGEYFFDDLALGTNGAIAAGDTSMTITGAAASTLILRAGDYLGGDGRPHIVAEDVTTDSGGNATAEFRPAASVAIGAGAVTYVRVTAPFRLTSDDAGFNAAEAGAPEQFDLEMVEDL